MTVLEKVASLFMRHSNVSEHIVVMSPQGSVRDEAKLVTELFKNGLAVYHLRRPRWQKVRFKKFIEQIPEQFRSRIVLHHYPDLVAKYNLGGFHLGPNAEIPQGYTGSLSAQCMQYSDAEKFGKRCRRLMLGPVFLKDDRDITIPTRTPQEFSAIISYWRKKNGSRTKFFAFGGVSGQNIATCKHLGFDGVTLVSAIWDSADPVKAFKEFKGKW
ncbi:MAG: thiamine phosphate synthase [Opitutae bacterium]|nr:thiamine phosphate synthase [Opitutae bacterium]